MRDLELPGRSPVHATNGMAATSHALATQTAVQILQAGGNAMDAAIAACAVQCVVEPGSTGIGGDNFCLYSPKGGDKIVAFNGSGKAPAAATGDWYRERGYKAIGRDVHAVTVPGAVDAWCQLHRDHGKLPFADILAPAIAYARDGYPISSRVHEDFKDEEEILRAEPTLAETFLVNGEVPAVGTRHSQPKLAATLQKIAEGGRDAFYKGAVAEDMVNYLRSKGGLHTLEDFANVSGDYVEPISTKFRDLTVWECPPNGQGVIALMLLNVMQGMDVDKSAGPITADRIHQEIEAGRKAYRARSLYLSDPQFGRVPVEELLSDEYAATIRDAIDMKKAGDPPQDLALPPHKDTVYITVVDKDRNACSFINTVFYGFGAGLMAPESGVLLQNRGMGFSLEEGHPNEIAPNKRPLHTIIPGMATKDGRTVLSFGVMGGEYQAFGHMQFLTRYIDYGLDIQEAMDAPRFMPDPFSGTVEIEDTVPQAIRDELTARGHRLEKPGKPIGGSQAIYIDWEQGVLTGGSEPRKDGCALGY
ncbi:gamma-glutamyltransferase [Rhodospirillaceae bacterium KN72]|uniref:Glutathione hydrolase proenzyme n=1 Tax=Pacificispira spongiicola TaxID=2729598 RepID=A0A7Y0E016_9PROT|nr:gamma-glutamyltransferase [Pacificispira spongiicola]NMM43996.1 gamma-glutamyltransferase [Pacificispira spongiicola]